MKFKNKFNSTFISILFCAISICTLHINTAKSQTLVWQDNFDSATINPNRWTYDVGDGCQIGNCGWGNAELENYTSKGAFKIRFENPFPTAEKMAILLFDDKGNCIRRISNLMIEGEIEKQIVVDNLSNGLYFIKYIIGNQSGVERIIILR